MSRDESDLYRLRGKEMVSSPKASSEESTPTSHHIQLLQCPMAHPEPPDFKAENQGGASGGRSLLIYASFPVSLRKITLPRNRVIPSCMGSWIFQPLWWEKGREQGWE